MSKRDQFYEDITAKIIFKLKQGVVPWTKSWKHGVPKNFITGRTYRGINYLNLCFEDFPSPYYLTYLQCKGHEGFVNKGAKSKNVIFWKICEIQENNSVKKVPFLRLSNLFNLSQTSLYNKNEVDTQTNISCQSIIDGMKNKPMIKHNFNRCYYNPKEDYISIPTISDFESEAEFLRV